MSDQFPAKLPAKPTYEQIRALEREMLSMEPGEALIEHIFADGVYCRKMTITAGTTLTGKIHRHSTLNILLEGRIIVTNADGAVRTLEAPNVFVSPPGCKKVGHALTDTVWLNVHPTKLTDLAAIEAKFIVPEAPHLLEEETPCLGPQ